MLFVCITRNCPFDIPAAERHDEDDGASIRRDGGRAIKNIHDTPRRCHSRSLHVLRRSAINLPEVERQAIVDDSTLIDDTRAMTYALDSSQAVVVLGAVLFLWCK